MLEVSFGAVRAALPQYLVRREEKALERVLRRNEHVAGPAGKVVARLLVVALRCARTA